MNFNDAFENCEKHDNFMAHVDLDECGQRNSKTVSIVIEFVKKSVQVKLHMN
jgi:hypothetical protein